MFPFLIIINYKGGAKLARGFKTVCEIIVLVYLEA